MGGLLTEAPDTQVAVGHAGSRIDQTAAGVADWKSRLADLAALPQATCKLSGFGMFDANWNRDSIAPLVEGCLELFGPDRCMFGSNFPVDKLFSDYARVFDSLMSLVPAEMHAAVFSDTAERFYRLG